MRLPVFAFAFAALAAFSANPRVLFTVSQGTTSLGSFTVEVDQAKAPVTAANFLAYVKSGFYNGTVFHRVIPGFMVQGGGMTADEREKKTNAPIKNEAQASGLKNLRGTIAMARTSDPNSATAQFFVNVVGNGFLDYPGQDGYGYCVFGKVTDAAGMATVDKIAAVPTLATRPVTPVVIQEAKVLPEK